MDFKDFTLFNIFYKNKKIYLILSIYNDPVNENELKITINNKTINVNKKLLIDLF